MKKTYQTPEIEFVLLAINERIATDDEIDVEGPGGDFSTSADPWAN